MSSFLDIGSSSNFDVNRQEQLPDREAESLSLDRRKNVRRERNSNPTALTTPKSTYIWVSRQALLVACITAFLISICSYDPSHSRPASQDTFSSICFPTHSKCLLRLYFPNVLVNPPAIVFVTSVLGFFTLVFVLHEVRRADIYQDQILAFGVACGFTLCGFLAIQEWDMSPFKNVMPGIITATFVTSVMLHTFLKRWPNA